MPLTQEHRIGQPKSIHVDVDVGALRSSEAVDGTERDADPGAEAPAAPAPAAAEALLTLVDRFLRDLHGDAADLPPVTPASELDRDLGLDSLGRMQLLLRVEEAFGVALPEETLATADTVADVLQAVRRSGPAAVHVLPGDEHGTPVPAPAEAGSPEDAATLLEVLAWHVRAHPERIQATVMVDGAERALSYRAMSEGAAAVAAGLKAAGLAPRETVAIMLPTSPEYFFTYLGVLMAGAVPVPIYPPGRPSQVEEHVLRHARVLDNARAVMLVTIPAAMLVARLLQAHVPGLRQVTTPERLSASHAAAPALAARAEDIAFIQYTSGSTGDPKGVVLTHANLLANIRAMAAAIQATPADVFVSWLPLYHDMGLIGAWLGSLYVGMPLVLMSPLAFLARPAMWLQVIQRWRGTLTAAPNFAYELCVKRIDDATLAVLDLGSLRLAFNGSEAVSISTLRRFGERFAACGLRPEAMAPVYGLAECCVGLLFPPLGRPPLVDSISRQPFTAEGRALPAAAGDRTALHFVACGRPLPGHDVRIVDAAGNEVPERMEGRLEFRGPSATRGYFRNPQKTRALFREGWLDSGDRAYRADGDIYVTGRVKDIVIRGGHHLYPEEIEEAVGTVEGIRNGCVAAFGSPDPATGTERLVVLAEVRSGAGPPARLREAIARAVTDAVGEPPDEVVLAPPHAVLKTSSGKVRRSACRERYESGRATRAAGAPGRQVARLATRALHLRFARAAGSLGRTLFACRAVALFSLMAPVVWLLTIAPGTTAQRAWGIGRAAARTFLRLTGLRPQVQGLEHLPDGPCVLVSNHASYLDGAILLAVLPRPYAFVAKRELGGQRVAGSYLRRLGAVFVERAEPGLAVRDAQVMADAVSRGQSLLVFAEGTFVAEPGLLPFRLGGFLAAARAGVPVVPIALRGDRDALPDGTWWPRRAAIGVQICEALAPDAAAPDLFSRAVRLRDAARRAIAAHVDQA